MTLLQIILVYFVSWWLVLLMLLPIGFKPATEVTQGHAPSAPSKPMLKNKFLWASALASLVTLGIYIASGYINLAHAAEEDMLHASSGVKTGGKCSNNAYHPPADINATEGTGSHGKQVVPATIGGTAAVPEVQLGINGDAYVPPPVPPSPTNPNSYLGLGKVAVGNDGGVSLDGKPLVTTQSECNQ